MWQPIETAPKDGTRFLGANDEGISITSWSDMWNGTWTDEASTTDDGHGWYGHDNWIPTHWMPLPEPPKTTY